MSPSTIQIFLPTGDPKGIRIAALTTSIVQIIEIPRKLVEAFLEMPEAKHVGVYFLVGDDNQNDEPSVYIGQTGDLSTRLREHDKDLKKGSWTRVLVATSLTHSLTQTHALFIEWRSIQQAKEVSRYSVKNGNNGSKPHTPTPLAADCVVIFDIMRMLLTTLGQPILEPLSSTNEKANVPDLFYLKSANYDATAEYTPEGMVVLKGSKARVSLAPSLNGSSSEKRRAVLVEEGALILVGDSYEFTKDVLFKSPSAASDAVVGASSNGWQLWKAGTGKTLDELQRPVAQKKALVAP